jgi:hypothetical protein
MKLNVILKNLKISRIHFTLVLVSINTHRLFSMKETKYNLDVLVTAVVDACRHIQECFGAKVSYTGVESAMKILKQKRKLTWS